MRSSEVVCLIQKIDPSKPFDEIKMTVEVVKNEKSTTTINTSTSHSFGRGRGIGITGMQGLGLMTTAHAGGAPQHVQVIMQGGMGE
jgi:hypothetical protein